ncbi:hypothetical protein [Synechococcus sp. SYN20]|uniref:hypothetical protein n=1 Tax=Synechococcus sp. SYN20 TaxID=1050714 RepID=UPI0016446833|nr:hypothetical protein [Synechococcus sp. SYN20]
MNHHEKLISIMRAINLTACLALSVLSFSSIPKASAEIGIDLKLGGGKPELEINDGNSDSSSDNYNSDSSNDNSDSSNDNSDSSSVDGNYDPCFIHPNCTAGAGYSSDNKNSMGAGWYCKDAKVVNTNTSFDKCNIRKGCTNDKNYVGYVANSKSWECLEKAYIHKGCSSTPGFANKGSLGAGWYCSDKKEVNQKTQFDPASIKKGCSDQGSGIKYTDGIWTCN